MEAGVAVVVVVVELEVVVVVVVVVEEVGNAVGAVRREGDGGAAAAGAGVVDVGAVGVNSSDLLANRRRHPCISVSARRCADWRTTLAWRWAADARWG